MSTKKRMAFDTTNIIVSSLPAYVQENHDVLVKDIALSGGTISRIGLQTGVKKSAYINLLDIAPEIQSGAGCGFSADGDITLTQRTIEAAVLKVNMDLCPETLRGKYAEYLLKTGANSEVLPFGEYITDGIIKGIADQMEVAIWQWQKSSSGSDLFDGLLYIAGAESGVIDVTIASGTSAYAGILQVYMALPELVLKKGAEIYVAPSVYRMFLQEMVAMNYFHYAGPQDAYPEEFILPGTNAKVVKTDGLAGNTASLKVLATFPANLVYGTDLESDMEEVKIWFSDDDDVWKFKAKWVSGVQIAFPDMVVLGAFAAAPTLGLGIVDALRQVAVNTAEIADADHVFKTDAQ